MILLLVCGAVILLLGALAWVVVVGGSIVSGDDAAD